MDEGGWECWRQIWWTRPASWGREMAGPPGPSEVEDMARLQIGQIAGCSVWASCPRRGA